MSTTPTTTLRVDFVSESAGYENTFGWYNKVTGLGGILFADVEQEGRNAPLVAGQSSTSFTVNTADVGNIQFFLISDGYNLNKNDSDDLTGAIKVIQLSNGSWAVADVDSHGNVITEHGKTDILNGAGANALFTETSKNAGGVDYASSVVGTNQTAATLAGDTADGVTGQLAWEDLAATRNKNGTYTKPGDADYNDAVFNVSIVGGNHAPVAHADSISVNEDAASTTINVLANDTDPDSGDVLHVSAVNTAGVLGTVAISANGSSITYKPAASFQSLAEGETATETFSYTVADQSGATSNASVTVTVAGVNDIAVITAQDLVGAITQQATPTGNLTDSGVITFTDVDLSDVHLVSANGAPVGSVLGTLTAVKDTDTTGTGAGGQLTWTYTVADSAVEYLAAGQTKVESFNITLDDQHGGLITKQIDVTITGTNDAPIVVADTNGSDLVVESGVAVGGNTALAGDPSAAGNVLLNDHDVDATDVLTVSGVVAGAASGPLNSNVGTSVAGTYGTLTLGSNGSWSYLLNNSDADTDALAQGESAADVFSYTTSDNHGGFTTSTLTVNITGTNDAPVITGGATTGSVAEDTTASQVSGQLNVLDPDHGAQQTWKVVGDNTLVGTADYHFRADSFTINKGSFVVLNDTFSDGLPPPNSPPFDPVGVNGAPTPTSYFVNGGFSESGGKLHLDSNNAVSFVGVGTSDPLIGEIALAQTNDDPSNLTQGLKIGQPFTISSVFDLVLPDSSLEAYGIRATDRHIGGSGTPPDQQGDDTFELVVRQNLFGQDVVGLRQLNFDTNVTTNLQSIVLAPPAGADQIRLVLDHAANASFLNASFQYWSSSSNTAVGSVQSFSQVAHIFGTAPGSVDAENWTNAGIVAYAPQFTHSNLGGSYGSLDVTQTGNWTYALNNGLASTQSLAQGQHATDTFTIQVADQYGALDTKTISIDVVGSNDAPVMQTGGTFRSLTEDLSADPSNKLTATGLAQFSDVDLTDTHSISVSLQSSSLGVNTPVASPPPAMPPALAALLPGAMSVLLTDPATGDGHGQLQWNFSLDNNSVQFLAFGQALTLNYLVNVTDSHGATTSQIVTVTINGNDDTPMPVAAGTVATGAVTETPYNVPEITHQVTGSVAFTDADLTDVHSAAGFVPGPAVLGNLSATIAPSNDSTGGVTGHADWTYTVNDTSLDYLAQGETATEHFTVLIDDGRGAIGQQPVTITLTGSNDLPILQSPDENRSFTQDSAPQFSASGSSIFSDVDHTDGHTVTSALQSATLSSGAALPAGLATELGSDFSATFVNDDSQFAFGKYNWDFSLANSAVKFLAQNEVLNVTYQVNVIDPFGGIASQDINIAVTGVNDAPIITTPDGSTTITGPSSALILSENFDQEAGGHGGQLIESYTGFQNWNVTRGNVDFYYEPNSFENVFPGNGGYVDLAGSTYGTLTSKTTYGPGTYEVTFSIGGTGRIPIYHNNPDGVNVSFGSYSENFMPGDSQIITVTRDITLTSSAQLSFADLGLSGNGNIGATIFGVEITQEEVTGSVTAVTSATSLTTSGTFAFTDVDLIDTHATTVTAASGDIGTLSAHVSTDTTGTGAGGIVTWDYQVSEAAAATLTTAVVDTFTVTLSDTPGANATETIRVAVLPGSHVNQSPVAIADIDSVVESGVNPGNTSFAGTPTAVGNVLNNDSDVDGGTHAVTAVNGSPASVGAVVQGTYGTLTLNSFGTYAYTLDNTKAATEALSQGEVKADVFTYTNTDNAGASSSTTLTINVTGTNDAPVANVDTNGGDSVIAAGLNPGNTPFGGDGFAAGNVLANDTDVDSGDSHVVTLVNGSAANVGATISGTYGALTLNTDGSWNYQLDNSRPETQALVQDEVKTEVFTYANADNNGASSSSTLTISVTGTNDGPVAVADTNAGDAVIEAGVNPGNAPFAGDPSAVGNVLANDTDADASGSHAVTAVNGSAAFVGTAVSGQYGSVTINADGSYAYILNNASPATEQLAQGATGTDIFVYTNTDNQGASSSTSLSITVAGTNDAPVAHPDFNGVTEAGTAVGGNTPFAGTSLTSGNALANDTDVDSSDSHVVTAVNGSAANVGAVVSGTYGTLTLNADGSYSYALNNALAATNALAQGEVRSDIFSYTNTDNNGASSSSTINIAVTGTNDAPVITVGATAGSVTEDAGNSASGKLTAVDPDHGAQQIWSVVGGTGAANADYHFHADSFSIARGTAASGVILQDDFSDNNAPPNSPPLFPNTTPSPTNYIVTGGFTESGGRLNMDSNNAASVVDVGNPDQLIGNVALVRTNIDPTNATAGLKLATNFTIAGVFDLGVPDSPRENYGIRVTDRLVGGSGPGVPPDQLGDNTYDLIVRQNLAGQDLVTLRHVDFASNVTTNLQNFTLNTAGVDQIRLILDHVANSQNVTASFQYLSGGVVVGGTTAFSSTAPIFAPGPADTEIWTRAAIVAFAPATSDSLLPGAFGTIDVDQTGKWTYTLDNTRTATQNLAQGQHASDTFTVQLADQFGATDSRVINVDVVGTNDAPVVTTAPVAISLTESSNVDGAGNLHSFGLAQFSDIDLTDTHTISATLQSSNLSGGGLLPAGLAALLNNAMSAGLTSPETGQGHGELQWNFSLANSAVQFLSAGQTLTLDYHINVADPFGGSSFQDVTVTVNGTDQAVATSVSNFSTIDYAGAVDTNANGINNSGQIVGQASLGDFSLPVSAIGWELNGGTYSSIAYPSAHITIAEGINESGVVSGFYEPVSSTPRYGFVESGGAFTQSLSVLSGPPAPSTTAPGINDAGHLAGSSYLNGGHVYSGFLDVGGAFTILNDPGAGSGYTFANGINNLDQVVGNYSPNGSNYHGFLYQSGVFTDVNDPLGVNGTIAADINNAGQIVGWYYDAANKPHGFLDTGGQFTTVDDPSATNGTIVQGINDAGQLVGYYIDGSSHTHGFVGTINNPVGAATDDVLVANPQGGALVGGAGADSFVFNLPPQNASTITDFTHGADVLQISASGFGHGLATGVGPAVLNATDAATVPDHGPGGYFIFDNAGPNQGALYWDPTGGTGADATPIAMLNNVVSLLSSDFHVV